MANIAGNPGFETAGAGGNDVFGTWAETASDGAIADELVVVHETSVHSCKLTAGVTKDTLVKQQITVEAGHRYLLTIWTYGDAGGKGPRIGVTNAAEAAYLINGGAIYAASDAAAWAKTRLAFTIPGAETHCHLFLECPDLDAAVCYFDDLSIDAVPVFWHRS